MLIIDRRELLALAAAGRELYACCTLSESTKFIKGGREQLDDFLTALAKCETRATAAKVKAQAEFKETQADLKAKVRLRVRIRLEPELT